MSAAELLDAVRSGDLKRVVAALDGGLHPDLGGSDGPPGLPLAMAAFLGHVGVVRELVRRGAAVNAQPGVPAAAAPIAMAARGKRAEVARVLLEMGADLPDGLDVGLRPEEIVIARQVAQHLGFAGERGSAPAEVETIEMQGLYGTDTNVLELEASNREALRTNPATVSGVNAPELDFGSKKR